MGLADERRADLLSSKPLGEKPENVHSVARVPGGLTEEEERELDELLNDDIDDIRG